MPHPPILLVHQPSAGDLAARLAVALAAAGRPTRAPDASRPTPGPHVVVLWAGPGGESWAARATAEALDAIASYGPRRRVVLVVPDGALVPGVLDALPQAPWPDGGAPPVAAITAQLDAPDADEPAAPPGEQDDAPEAAPSGADTLRDALGLPPGPVVPRPAHRAELLDACLRGHGGVLRGVGGSGTSTLAADVAATLAHHGWAVAVAPRGPTVHDVGMAVAAALDDRLGPATREALRDEDTPRRDVIDAVADLLRREPVLLLLDRLDDAADYSASPVGLDHEDRLALPPPLRDLLEHAAAAARHGAVLVTCRHAVADVGLRRLTPVAGLTSPQADALLRAAPAWRDAPAHERRDALNALGTHPGALLFAGALARPEADPVTAARASYLGSRWRIPVADLSATQRWQAASALAAAHADVPALLARLSPGQREAARRLAVFRQPVPADALGDRGVLAAARLERMGLATPHRSGPGEAAWSLSPWLRPAVLAGGDEAAAHHDAAAWWSSRPGGALDAVREALAHQLTADALSARP